MPPDPHPEPRGMTARDIADLRSLSDDPTPAQVESNARRLAAKQMGLQKDLDGKRLPDDLWMQKIAEVKWGWAYRRALEARRSLPLVLDALAAAETREAALRDMLREAETALRSFSEAADCLDNPNPDHMEIWEHSAAMCITAGDLRRAKRFMKNIARITGALAPASKGGNDSVP